MPVTALAAAAGRACRGAATSPRAASSVDEGRPRSWLRRPSGSRRPQRDEDQAARRRPARSASPGGGFCDDDDAVAGRGARDSPSLRELPRRVARAQAARRRARCRPIVRRSVTTIAADLGRLAVDAATLAVCRATSTGGAGLIDGGTPR